MNELSKAKATPNEADSVAAPASGIARRRLLRAGMAAAPLMLTLSGRSAMATSTGTPVGLSPMAWNSVAPNGTFVAVSHTVGTHPLGKSPGFWKPNKNGQTFQAPQWPVAPFDSVMTKMTDGSYMSKSWNSYPYLDFKGVDSDDPGFANGAKFSDVFFGGDNRSFSQILLGENDIDKHFCAAYLNVLAYAGTYAITLAELKDLHSTRKLVPGGTSLSDGVIKAFLKQTWN